MSVLTNLQLLSLDNNKIDSAAINTWGQEHPNIREWPCGPNLKKL